MSVHEAITKHVKKQNKIIDEFLALDKQREHYIEEAIILCKQGSEFTTDKINQVTGEMNELSKQGIVPPRKYVTVDMVKEYVMKLDRRGDEV
ncbi:DUF2533 domain-containing protein [Bacillus canaveralius]|uniref:DUF2533 domain-containing protein n=1 Tax=Bacillus canaveralius TaxID=1403243 RepID=A0A2N5GGM1_9BACI|nr:MULTISPECIES: YpbS family protein [Bacillus]PLR79907.1 DUF2533 domain-containing protein [Bacillus canaveralius]PLR82395.1 DUF2533 domain-containing protein [Bacillus sp. V33-4]PLR96004.1 DUF2533 domain-containing protein [Bacillus canaveralius]RSK51628.1 DUF2533 family protein [Bacillus canaveralius]